MIPSKKKFITKMLDNHSDLFAFYLLKGINVIEIKLEDIINENKNILYQVPKTEFEYSSDYLVDLYINKFDNYNLVCFFTHFDMLFEKTNSLNKILNNEFSCNTSLKQIVNKSDFYKLCSEVINMPQYGVFSFEDEEEEILKFIKDNFLQGEYLFKPIDGTDSDGVYKSKKSEGVYESLDNFIISLSTINFNNKNYIESSFIIMEYITYNGKDIELTIDGCVKNFEVEFFGIHEKIKVKKTEPFYDTLMTCPPVSSVIKEREKEIEQILSKLITALKYECGTFHFEFRLGEYFYPIDCSLRTGGGYIPHSINYNYNVDLRTLNLVSYYTNDFNLEFINNSNNKGSVIGVVFTEEISFNEMVNIYNGLTSNIDVLNFHFDFSYGNDPYYQTSMAISFLITGNSADEALINYQNIAAKYNLATLF